MACWSRDTEDIEGRLFIKLRILNLRKIQNISWTDDGEMNSVKKIDEKLND